MKIQFSRASEKIRSHFFSRFFEIETLVNDCRMHQFLGRQLRTLTVAMRRARSRLDRSGSSLLPRLTLETSGAP